MPPAEPPHVQGIVILIVMGIDCLDPANFTGLLFQLACLHRSLHGQMGIVFTWVGTAPIRLAGIGFQH